MPREYNQAANVLSRWGLRKVGGDVDGLHQPKNAPREGVRMREASGCSYVRWKVRGI